MYNPNSLDTICGALAYALGIEAPSEAAPANPDLTAYIDEVFGGEKSRPSYNVQSRCHRAVDL